MTALAFGTLLSAAVLPGPAAAPDMAAQAGPAPSPAMLAARHADTYAEDIALTNQCVRDGGGKATCLCVTKILKHELNLRDYGDAVAGYVRPETASRALRKPELVAASHTQPVFALTASPDFAQRCAAADWFFRMRAEAGS
ncbi:MAG: hypothetical protein AAF311_13480 [Pseudomonadota bacterium]